MILERITSDIYWVLIAILVLNMMQRKHIATGKKKRNATLITASLILLLNILFALILSAGLPQWTGLLALIIAIGVGYMFRDRLLLFRMKCVRCSKRVDFNTLMFHDSNVCTSCREQEHAEKQMEQKAHEEQAIEEEEPPQDTSEIDWELWIPDETAVLCYIFKDNKVLLIHKKTGLGNGLVNAPGGRIEEAETAIEAAVRETEEETGLTPLNLTQMAMLNFQFFDGYTLRGHVFVASDCSGEMTETQEADPFWVDMDKIPYDKMWEDDRYWLPQVIEGHFIEGRFLFDDRTMVSHELIRRS